jgi:membrane protein DedA with SNARE-associated domain
MTLAWLCLIWVFLSATVATLPLRMQFIPGAILLVAGPLLIVVVGFEVGFVFSVIALAAYVSMFRNPLLFLLAKLRGRNPEVPR